MNKELIRKLVKCKLNLANELLKHLPPEMSEEIKNIGEIILESLNDTSREIKDQYQQKSGHSTNLNSVPVE
jgi:fumarate hydratase class II